MAITFLNIVAMILTLQNNHIQAIRYSIGGLLAFITNRIRTRHKARFNNYLDLII